MQTRIRLYTVDSSVFLNAFNWREPGHEHSRNFLDQIRREAAPIIEPALVAPEVAAAVARRRDDTALAREFAAAVSKLPHLVLIPMDDAIAFGAADVAAENRLRGADAVYAAIALRFGATLVTCDREQRERVARILPTVLPAEALVAG